LRLSVLSLIEAVFMLSITMTSEILAFRQDLKFILSDFEMGDDELVILAKQRSLIRPLLIT
jgi:hypothetical protein